MQLANESTDNELEIIDQHNVTNESDLELIDPNEETDGEEKMTTPFLQRIKQLPFTIYHDTRFFFAHLIQVFGWRFLIFVCTSQMLLKGLVYYVVSNLMLPLFKQVFQVDASHLQFMLLIVMIPWSIKPLIGLCSDMLIIGGYNKRPWLYVSLVAGLLGSGFAFLAFSNRSAVGMSLCLMGIQLEIATFDLMSEASYSAVMRDRPEIGSDMVVLVQAFQHAGAIVAMLFVGAMADAQVFYGLFGICAGLCLLPLVPTVMGWICEPPSPQGKGGLREEQSKCRNFIRFTMHDESAAPPQAGRQGMIAIIAFTGLAAPITALCANALDPSIGLAIALLLTIGSLFGAFVAFPRMVFNVAAFQVITSLARPALGSAMDYFYTADEACLPGGPHFSMTFYMTTAGLIGTVMTFLGTLIYKLALSKMRFRTVLIITTILSGAIGASDLFLVLRLNIALGWSDKAVFLLGESIFEPVLGMLNYIPMMALLSKVVPEGMESSCFAYLAGLSNFASMISELSGGLIFEAAGVVTVGKCNFDSLWWLILICHVGMPIVGGVVASLLIPNKLQTEELTEN